MLGLVLGASAATEGRDLHDAVERAAYLHGGKTDDLAEKSEVLDQRDLEIIINRPSVEFPYAKYQVCHGITKGRQRSRNLAWIARSGQRRNSRLGFLVVPFSFFETNGGWPASGWQVVWRPFPCWGKFSLRRSRASDSGDQGQDDS